MRRLALLSVLILLATSPLAAQQAEATEIPMFSGQNGVLAAHQSARYTFNGVTGQIISAWVRGDDTLDPVLQLSDSSGRVLLSADDIAYPERRDALIEAASLPYTDRYTLTVSGYDGSAGSYTLTLNAGFADLQYSADFAAADEWSAAQNAVIAPREGQLDVSIAGQRTHGAAVESLYSAADVAVYAEVKAVDASRGWSAGLVIRQQGAHYYLYEVNDEGRWRFLRVNGSDVTVLSEWRSHPAIRAGATQFSLMTVARRDGFGLFYDNALVGALSDTALPGAGAVGLAAGTYGGLPGETRVTFDNLRATAPLTLDGEIIIPEQVGTSAAPVLSQSLIWRHVAEADGEMALTVPEASVNYARTGINRFMLGQSTTYTHFAMAGTVDIGTAPGATAGCGFAIHFANEQNYTTAYLDAQGGYGISTRVSGEFEPGLFGENPGWAGGGRHHLLILADAPRLYLYVDGALAGSTEIAEASGEVGIAALNYETVDTMCSFENVWLWAWN